MKNPPPATRLEAAAPPNGAMSDPPPAADPQAPPGPDEVMRLELSTIFGDVETGNLEERKKALWGLALSGGGIRSATFAVGLMQELARTGALNGFHYLSTVSGGGYAGALVQGAIKRFGFEQTRSLLTARAQHDAEDLGRKGERKMRLNRPIRHLREYSNYLSPWKSSLSGDTLGMIATYLRNVLLTQAQLVSLLLAISLLPLAVAPLLDALAGAPLASLSLAAICAVIAAAWLAWLSSSAETHVHATNDGAPTPAAATVSALVGVLLACASVFGALGIFNVGDAPLPTGACALIGLDVLWPACATHDIAVATALAYAGVWVGWFVIDVARSQVRGKRSLLCERWGWFLFGSLGTAVITGLIVTILLSFAPASDRALWSPAIWGAPLVFIAAAAAATIQIGLVGPALSDLQREVWARIGGKSGALVLIGVFASLGVLVMGPWAVGAMIWGGFDFWGRFAGWLAVATWIATSFGGVFASRVTPAGQGDRGNALRGLLMAIAPSVFILGLWIGIGLLSQILLSLIGAGEFMARDQASSLSGYLDAMAATAREHPGKIWILIGASSICWFLLSLAMDANELSLNAFYRNRLVRCFLGATNVNRNPEPVTNFDPRDDMRLCDVVPPLPGGLPASGNGSDGRIEGESESDAAQLEPAPPEDRTRPLYPLIGGAMNLVAAKQLDWQDRRAASFLMSPHYCGHLPPEGRTGADAAGDRAIDLGTELALSRQLQLGTAIAVSGAAVSPNMGARSSPAITFLLTLFDARLGWWLPNRIHQRKHVVDRPRFPGWHLIAELLGFTHGTGRFAHVSDGGHFENLALYELVRRRCRFILCSDAGADPKREFADLGNAIQKCRVDFGAEIEIDVGHLRPDPATGLSRRHATLGKIRYDDDTVGVLLYLKPTLLGDEPADIEHYAAVHREFPHEPTADQYFDEAQFECYRRLGEHIGCQVVGTLMSRGGKLKAGQSLTLGNSEAKEQFLQDATHQLYDPIAAVAQHFSRHGEAVTRLFEKLRATPALAVLDAQFYPGWTHAMTGQGSAIGNPAAAHAALPATAQFRECFYFCLELIQLMESVYIDLDLETNHTHPDNRGWMNIFRHWSWSPAFRVTWALSAQTFGARFVSFCEVRVGIPSIVGAMRVVKHIAADGEARAQFAARLRDAGHINFAEADILVSAPLLNVPIDELWLLQLRWDKILARKTDLPVDLTLGMSLVSADHLVLFRIQDHVRRLGLGAVFMRKLLEQRKLDGVRFLAGDYGAVGILRTVECSSLQTTVDRMFREALLRRKERTKQSRAPA